MSLDDEPVDAPPRASRWRFVVIGVAAGALALVVAAGAIAAPLLLRAPSSDDAAAPAPAATAPVASTVSTPRPTPTVAAPDPVAPPAPADPAAPAPVDPAPDQVAPPASAPQPQPPLPAPPPPVIPPVVFQSISAIPTNDFCNSKDGVTLTWSIANALPGSVTVDVTSGGGLPVFDHRWTGLDPQQTYNFAIVDCTRTLWFFRITATNLSGSKQALLTFANGTNKGWTAN